MVFARPLKIALIPVAALLISACGGGGGGGGSETAAADGNTTATLTWTAPFQRNNGESLSMGEISQYVVRYGNQPDPAAMANELIVDGQSMATKITDLSEGNWYFAMRTVDQAGLESDWSEVVSKRIVQ